MKLISMTDFVLNDYNKTMNTPYKDGALTAFCAEKYVKYANFLKQPLELWMFVPCDEEGDVLEEPTNLHAKLNASEYFTKKEILDAYTFIEEYDKAKDRVLFEIYNYDAEDELVFFKNEDGSLWQLDIEELEFTVEDISIGNITLTPTAIKQIGL